MKKILFISILVMCGLLSASAQEFEYGKPSELKGLTKVFIDTGTDLKTREKITKEIVKAKIPTLELTDSAEDAEIILFYRGESSKVSLGATVIGATVIDNSATLSSGKGLVFIGGRDNKKPRLLISVENIQDNKAEKHPATKFAKEFIKAYKLANEIK